MPLSSQFLLLVFDFVTLSEKISCALLMAVRVATSAQSVPSFQVKMTSV